MKKLLFITVICCLFLASCNAVRKSAGVNRKVIDEYNIVENPPLVIPPNFNLLPPEQIESKNVDDVDSDLAKEILFGLDENEDNLTENNSLINQIVIETGGNQVDNNIREDINQEFAGERSTKKDEITFENEEELNQAIKNSKKLEKKNNKKKKKRFFFF